MSRRNRHPAVVDQGTPDWTKRPPLPLTQHIAPPGIHDSLPPGALVSIYRLGECGVIRTYHAADGGWRLSVSHPSRYPRWDEICEARYRLLPDDVWMAIALPPRSRYVNVHPNCFQMIQIPPHS